LQLWGERAWRAAEGESKEGVTRKVNHDALKTNEKFRERD